MSVGEDGLMLKFGSMGGSLVLTLLCCLGVDEVVFLELIVEIVFEFWSIVDEG